MHFPLLKAICVSSHQFHGLLFSVRLDQPGILRNIKNNAYKQSKSESIFCYSLTFSRSPATRHDQPNSSLIRNRKVSAASGSPWTKKVSFGGV